jgi:hypothetical protein
MRRSAIEHGVETIELDSWNEFYQLVASDFLGSPAYVFRGQADARWKVESSLDRWERLHSKRTNRPPVSRHVHLRAFRQAIRAISPVALQKEDDALSWALAQHHGLRTPLLDWSLSPFVALYFAFEHRFIREDDRFYEPEVRAVFALSASAIARGRGAESKRGIFPQVYSPSGPVSQRLLAQSSLFLMMPEKGSLEEFVSERRADLPNDASSQEGNHSQPTLKKICMRGDGRRECLKVLNKMNINRLTLFPDLDGAARYINDLWELDFDSALGYFEDSEYAEATNGDPASCPSRGRAV